MPIGESMMVETRSSEIALTKIKHDPIKTAFGILRGKLKQTGVEYVDSLRATWKDRDRAITHRIPLIATRNKKHYEKILAVKIFTPY